MSSTLAAQLKKQSQQIPAPATHQEFEHRSMPPQITDRQASTLGGYALSRMRLYSDTLAAPTAQSCSKGYTKPSHCPFGGACHTCPSAVQAKLTVSQPGDKYEEEADRTADRIMRMAAPGGDDEPSGLTRLQVSAIQRSCPTCEDDDEIRRQPMDEDEIEDEGEGDDVLQAKQASGGGLAVSPALQAQIGSMRGGGQPLPASVRGFFEPRFGYDLSGVRVHTDARAAQTAHAVGAQAFAVGQSIVFGNGRYAPETSAGKRLLAHELAHTIQQSDRRAPASTSDMLFRTGERPDWCSALVRLVEYEDANGIAATLLRYNPLNSDLLVPLNYDIPSIYGPVDVDWMLRITFSQLPTIGPSIFSPALAQVMGYVASYESYFGAKLFWNTIRSFSDQYDFEIGSIFQEANLNAPSVVVHWIHGESLRHIFAPALELCGQQSSNQQRERPAVSVAQAPAVARTQAEGEMEMLQAKLSPGREPEVTPGIASTIHGLRGGGQPIEPSARAFMENRFGLDLRDVRVHADASAARIAHSLNARAFTFGTDIVFANGQYSPDAGPGKQLIAHELTHVVQQRQSQAGALHADAAVRRKQYPGTNGEPFAILDAGEIADLNDEELAEELALAQARLATEPAPTILAGELPGYVQALEAELGSRGKPDQRTEEEQRKLDAAERPVLAALQGYVQAHAVAQSILGELSGSQLDPGLVETVSDQGSEVMDQIQHLQGMSRVLAAMPQDKRTTIMGAIAIATQVFVTNAEHLMVLKKVVSFEIPDSVRNVDEVDEQLDKYSEWHDEWVEANDEVGELAGDLIDWLTGASEQLETDTVVAEHFADFQERQQAQTKTLQQINADMDRMAKDAQGIKRRAEAIDLALIIVSFIRPRGPKGARIRPRRVPKGPGGPRRGPGRGSLRRGGPRVRRPRSERRRERRRQRRQRRSGFYPICWPIQLGPTVLRNGIPVPVYMRTTGTERDVQLAHQQRLQLRYRQEVDPDFNASRYDVHHIVPLFLGGLDMTVNMVTLPKGLHQRGHPILAHQPQMQNPPRGLKPLPADLYKHPPGTRYRLVGFKKDRNEICGRRGR